MNVATEDPMFWRLFALAQALPQLPPRDLILWLEQTAAQPLTLERLGTLTLAQLSESFPAGSATPTLAQWQGFMAVLAGQLPDHLTTHNERGQSLQLRAAFASSNGLAIDGHFGQSKLFFIYAFDEQGPFLQQVRRYRDRPDEEEGNEARARMLSDCHLLFCEAIGGPAAARVIRNNIHPIKIKPPMAIDVQLQALRTMLAERIPPWLAKRLGKTHPLAQHQFSL